MKNKSLFILIGVLLLTTLGYAQNKDLSSDLKKKLEGLKKFQPDANTEIMLDGESFPVYQLNGNTIKGMEMFELISSGKFQPELYADEHDEIKACVLIPVSGDDKITIETIPKGATLETPPPFVVTDINGQEFSLEELKGKVVVLNFWFTACKPCIMEMPELNELVEEFKAENVVFLALTFNSKKQLTPFLKKKPFNYHIIPNSQHVVNDYKIEGFPTHFVINQKGEISFTQTGYSSGLKEQLQKEIKKLIN